MGGKDGGCDAVDADADRGSVFRWYGFMGAYSGLLRGTGDRKIRGRSYIVESLDYM